MNKNVESNRKAFVAAGEDLCKTLTKLINLCKTRKDDYLKLTERGVYSGDYVKTRVEEMDRAYREAAAKLAPELMAEIKKISDIGMELDNAIEIADPDLAAALQILEASNANIDLATQDFLLKNFKGNQKALRIIRSVFQKHDKRTDAFDLYIFDFITDVVSFLEHRVDAVTLSEPDANWPQIQEMQNKIIRVCKLIGAEYTPEQFALGSYAEDLSTINIRRAMGLPAQ